MSNDREEWLLRLKSQDAEIQKLREALGVAREALEEISNKIGRAVDDNTNLYSSVICAKQALAKLDAALAGKGEQP